MLTTAAVADLLTRLGNGVDRGKGLDAELRSWMISANVSVHARCLIV